ncbi:hypothetical protein C8Q75DRAFT_806486 [Abortiporus biennis]|nr:hypothetical protein C8Q75DRAFT_806486 [Abortiporus biennis]
MFAKYGLSAANRINCRQDEGGSALRPHRFPASSQYKYRRSGHDVLSFQLLVLPSISSLFPSFGAGRRTYSSSYFNFNDFYFTTPTFISTHLTMYFNKGLSSLFTLIVLAGSIVPAFAEPE